MNGGQPVTQLESIPDLEDNMPSGIVALPPASQPWAMSMHKAMLGMRKEWGRVKWFLVIVIPLEVAVLAGAFEIYSKLSGK